MSEGSLGRVPNGTGLLSEDQAASRPAPSGVDPSRGWLPIATAPKDGTEVLIFCPTTREQFVAFYYDGLWQYAFYSPDMRRIMCERASHWMPLPTPPAQGIEARSAETRSGAAEGESPVGRETDAPEELQAKATQNRDEVRA